MCKDSLLEIVPNNNQKFYRYIAYTYRQHGHITSVYCPFCIEINYITDQLTLENMDGNQNICDGCNDNINDQYKKLKSIVESYSVEDWTKIVNVNLIEQVKKLLGVY